MVNRFKIMRNKRGNYVKSKAKIANDTFKTLHNKSYSFDASKVFSEDTLCLFKNLRKDYIQLYEILLNDFLKDKEIKSEMEKLIWTSEFLEALNSNHNFILSKMDKITNT